MVLAKVGVMLSIEHLSDWTSRPFSKHSLADVVILNLNRPGSKRLRCVHATVPVLLLPGVSESML